MLQAVRVIFPGGGVPGSKPGVPASGPGRQPGVPPGVRARGPRGRYIDVTLLLPSNQIPTFEFSIDFDNLVNIISYFHQNAFCLVMLFFRARHFVLFPYLVQVLVLMSLSRDDDSLWNLTGMTE